MAKQKRTLQDFQATSLSEAKQKTIKGGFKLVADLPGGVSSTGMIDWGEVEIRVYGFSASNKGDMNQSKSFRFDVLGG